MLVMLCPKIYNSLICCKTQFTACTAYLGGQDLWGDPASMQTIEGCLCQLIAGVFTMTSMATCKQEGNPRVKPEQPLPL